MCDPIEYIHPNVTEYVQALMGSRCTSSIVQVPTVVIYSIIFILGTVGNVCTCIVIIANKHMHNPTNFYLFSLAISDILVLVFGLPMELYQVFDYTYPYTFSVFLCKARAFLIEFTSYASILTIFCFSYERWNAICHPLEVKSMSSNSRAYCQLCFVWLISFICAMPMALIVIINRVEVPTEFMDLTKYISNDGLTIMNTDFCAMDVTSMDQQTFVILFAFVAFFAAPAAAISWMYLRIMRVLHRAEDCLSTDIKMSQKRNKANKNATAMLASVVISFYICWLPFHMQRILSIVVNHYQNLESLQFLFSIVYYASGYCYYSNSACNPILYNVMSQKYRRAFCRTILGENLAKKIFPKWCEKQTNMHNNRSNAENGSSDCNRSYNRPLLKAQTSGMSVRANYV